MKSYFAAKSSTYRVWHAFRLRLKATTGHAGFAARLNFIIFFISIGFEFLQLAQ